MTETVVGNSTSCNGMRCCRLVENDDILIQGCGFVACILMFMRIDLKSMSLASITLPFRLSEAGMTHASIGALLVQAQLFFVWSLCIEKV